MLGFSLILLVLSGGVYDETPLTVNPDPNYVMGTYEEWMEGQPLYEPLTVTTISGTDGAEFLLIFQEGLTDSLTAGLLDQWTGDIQSQGITTEVRYFLDLRWLVIMRQNDGIPFFDQLSDFLMNSLHFHFIKRCVHDLSGYDVFNREHYGAPLANTP